MVAMRISTFALLLAGVFAACHCEASAETASRWQYRVLSTRTEIAPPFEQVDFVRGPVEKVGRNKFYWWQVEVRAKAGATNAPSCIVRGLTSDNPMETTQALRFARYELRIPETGEALEYVEAHSGMALLPAWQDFQKWFVPHAAACSHRQNGAPETGEFLGQILTLQGVKAELWTPWQDVKRLEFDREMLVGTGRNFKDVEGHRLPQTPKKQDYTYTNFTAEDYRTMIDAGMNLFTIAADQEQFVRDEPVFYTRAHVRKSPPRFPADLYRANFLGTGMFLDEPASVLTWDKYAGGLMTHFSDAAAVIEGRTRATFQSSDLYYGSRGLESQMPEINFGEMRLAATELPVWETQFDRSFYILKGGGSGIVHEGRYQLGDFNKQIARVTGKEGHYSAEEMLRYYYAFLRGGAEPAGKFWGTAIYGQCDPKLAPRAFTLAYDMGARYFWFWTSDHGHHVPWVEQVELSRQLKEYAKQHPRSSIYGLQRKRDTAIAIPNGYFLTFGNLYWMRGIDLDGKNAESQHYRELFQRTLQAVDECFQRNRDFNITIDDGRRIEGYKHVVKIQE